MANPKIVKYAVTINHIVNNMVRSQSLIVDAPENDLDTAKLSALDIAKGKGWIEPRVTKTRRY